MELESKNDNSPLTERKPIKLKALFLGDSSVGKTVFFHRIFNEKENITNQLPTIGIQFKTKNIKFGGENVRLELWDTAGQERYTSITKNYIKGANGIFLLYDITREETLPRIRHWIKEIQNAIDINYCAIIIIGNKKDLEDKRTIKYEDGLKFAIQNNLNFIETSGFTGENIKEALSILMKSMMEKRRKFPEIEQEMDENRFSLRKYLKLLTFFSVEKDFGDAGSEPCGC